MTKKEKALWDGLQAIIGLAPSEEPDVEDYDDTESASGQGVAMGLWEAAEIARAAMRRAYED